MLLVPKIKYHLSRTALRRPFYWYRHRGITAADVFVVCFPRSGSTWLRFLLCGALISPDADFEQVYRRVPALGGQSHADSVLPGRGRVIRTHEAYRREYRKAVYLVRDVRDSLVSNYTYLCGRDFFRGTLGDFVEPFVSGRLYGYGHWRGHLESWWSSPLRSQDRLLLVRYEDLRQETEATLRRILDFMGVEVAADRIRQSIENSTLQQMKKKEQKARQTTFRDYPDGFRFVQKGSVGGWQTDLSPEHIARLESYAGEWMDRLGYPPTSGFPAGREA